jgi:enamine deaminase RidA (YjgF/YER057c/UK114 family)
MQRLEALGLKLPKPWSQATSSVRGTRILGPGVEACAEFVRIVDRRVTISGHLPLNDDGAVTGPFERVGAGVTLEQAQSCAARAMLGIFATLVHEIGTLDRVAAWIRIFGMVNAVPDFHDYPSVINPASRLVYDVFGNDIGRHSRLAIGVAGLPFNAPVEIEAEVLLLD